MDEEDVINGNSYFSQELLRNLIESKSNSDDLKLKLSRREGEVLELVCQGLSNQEISDKLFLSTNRMFLNRGNNTSIYVIR